MEKQETKLKHNLQWGEAATMQKSWGILLLFYVWPVSLVFTSVCYHRELRKKCLLSLSITSQLNENSYIDNSRMLNQDREWDQQCLVIWPWSQNYLKMPSAQRSSSWDVCRIVHVSQWFSFRTNHSFKYFRAKCTSIAKRWPFLHFFLITFANLSYQKLESWSQQSEG